MRKLLEALFNLNASPDREQVLSTVALYSSACSIIAPSNTMRGTYVTFLFNMYSQACKSTLVASNNMIL